MRGSISKRGQTWTVVYDEPSPDGNRRQRRKGGFPTKRSAQQYLNDALSRLDGGTYSAPEKATFGDYLDEWLPSIRDGVKPSTHDRYVKTVRLYVRPHLGHVRLQAVTPTLINAMYNQMAERGLSASTRRLTHAVVGRALGDAFREGRITTNPARRARAPRSVAQRRVEAFTDSELRRFLEHTAGMRLGALWRLAATTGMRRGEILGLRWQDVNLDAARLQVVQQLVPTRGGVMFSTPKSRRGTRTIALDAETVASLREHRDVQIAEQAYAGPAWIDDDLVFCNPLGRPIHPQWLTDDFREQRKRAGITHGSLHTLRHTAITIALCNGIPVHVVAARAGDTPATILGSYAHLLPTSDEQAAEAIAAALSGVS